MDLFWARGLKYLPSQFLRLLLPLVLFFIAQYSYWTILHNILDFPDPSYSLGILGPFYSLGHSRTISFSPSFLHSHGLLLNSLGSLGPIATSFSFGFIGLQTNSIYQFLYLVSSGLFYLFSFYFSWFPCACYFILWGFLGLFAFFGATLLFCGFVDHYSCHLGLLVLFCYFISSPFFHIVGLLLLLGPFAKMVVNKDVIVLSKKDCYVCELLWVMCLYIYI